jgi:hypothetical protein
MTKYQLPSMRPFDPTSLTPLRQALGSALGAISAGGLGGLLAGALGAFVGAIVGAGLGVYRITERRS